MTSRNLSIPLAGVLGLIVWCNRIQAQVDDPPKPAESQAKAADLYTLPEGASVKELIEFVERILNSNPRRDAQAMREYQARAMPAIRKAIEIIQRTATDEDRKLPGFNTIVSFSLRLRTGDAAQASPAEQKALLDDIKAYLLVNEEPSDVVNAARSLALNLEMGGSRELALMAYRELGPILARRNDPMQKQAGTTMEGAARRMDLRDMPLPKLTGTTIEGSQFDWAKYQGKVVLVDFWATWCGPCIAELPNVKKAFAAYHDRGFEVVGISIDANRADLDEFLRKQPLPWVTLTETQPTLDAMQTYYGIMAIPTTFLVDQKGIVVSTNARGGGLISQLAKLLGPMDDKPADKDADRPGN